MTELDVAPLALGDLKVMLEGDALRLVGSADITEPKRLGETLRQLHSELVRTSTKEIVVDFRLLEFMNSSCFKEFVTWLAGLEDLAPTQRYRIRLLSDASKHWQKRSLEALRCFATDLVQVEAKRAG